MALGNNLLSGLSGMGDALGSFRANLRGQGPEYRGALEQQEAVKRAREQAEKKRVETNREEVAQGAALDSIVALDHLNNGNIDAFNKLTQDRVKKILFAGRNPDNTLEIAEMVKAGDIEGAKKELKIFAREAQLRKLLPKDDKQIQSILGKEPPKTQSQVNVLRKDIKNVNNDFREIQSAYKRLKSGLARGTAAGDMAGVFNFMKINDPGSTVREGEYATAKNAGGWTDRMRNIYNAAIDGTILTPKQRKDFLETATGLLAAQRSATDGFIENILQQADADEISRERVFGKERLADLVKRKEAREKPPSGATRGSIKKVSTQAEIKALPSGTPFIWTDGKRYITD